jgi:hypothetical protein
MKFSYLGEGLSDAWCVDVDTQDPVVLVRHVDAETDVMTTFKFAVVLPEIHLLVATLQGHSDRGLKALKTLEKWAGSLDDLEACKAAYAANQQGVWWAELEAPLTVARWFECGQPHHVTLLYKATYGDGAALENTVHEFVTTELCRDERVEALRVTLPVGLPCNKTHPHVSVSWQPGVSPAASNEMLIAPTHVQPHVQRFQARVQWQPHWA